MTRGHDDWVRSNQVIHRPAKRTNAKVVCGHDMECLESSEKASDAYRQTCTLLCRHFLHHEACRACVQAYSTLLLNNAESQVWNVAMCFCPCRMRLKLVLSECRPQEFLSSGTLDFYTFRTKASRDIGHNDNEIVTHRRG